MAAAAARGLELHEQGRSGDGLKPETVKRAGRIARREVLTPEHVREMRAWFRRHKVDRRPGWGDRGAETPGYTAWMLWGGDPGWRWSEVRVAQMERRLEKRDAPAPPEDQIKGSDTNAAGSAERPATSIDVSDPVRKSLQSKVISHNAAMKKEGRPKWSKATLGQLLAVYRRGAGAYSTSHRPNVTRGAWAMARVNAYLHLLRTGRPQNEKYVTDNDLLPAGHPKRSEEARDSLNELEYRSRKMGRARKKKPKLSPRTPAKMGAFAGCGTGAGGFKPGNRCGKEDGIPNKPHSLGGALRPVARLPAAQTAAIKTKIAAAQSKAASKQKAKQAADRQKSIQIKRAKAAARKQQKDAAAAAAAKEAASSAAALRKKRLIEIKRAKAAIRKKEKEAAAKEEAKKAADAAASKRAEMLAKIRAARAAKKEAAKKAIQDASKKLSIAGEKSFSSEIEKQIATLKDAQAKKTAAQKQLDDKAASVTFSPNQDTDGLELNGTKLAPPAKSEFWKGAKDAIKEPDFDPKFAGHNKSFGCVVVEPDGRVWVIEPKGHFGGYEHTFPKGGMSPGETNQQAALREVFEETGLQVRIQAHLGDFERTTGVTRYYIAKRVGGTPSLAGGETATVKLVRPSEAKSLLNKDIDKKIMDAAEAQRKAAPPPSKPAPTKKPPAPPPTTTPIPPPKELTVVKALGGSTGAKLATDAAGNQFVIKTGNSSAHIKSESQADELYRAAGVLVPSQQIFSTPSGTMQKVAEFIKGKTLAELKATDKKKFDAAVRVLRRDFVADALFNNRDVIGANFDNVVVGKGGKVYRVDNGGSLDFRAQGGTKTFEGPVKELGSMRDPSKNPTAAEVYGSLTPKEINTQITRLLKKEADILSAAKSANLQKVLAERFQYLKAWQQNYKNAGKPPLTPSYEKANGVNLAKAVASLKGESPEVIKAIKTGKTSESMTIEQRHKVVSAVWSHTLTANESSAISKWGGHASGTVISDEKKGAATPSDLTREFKKGVAKLPNYSGKITRTMGAISGAQIKSWIASGKWTTERVGHEGFPTHASFSTVDRLEAAQSRASSGQSAGQGDVVIVVRNAMTAADTGKKLPHYSTVYKGSQEAEVIVRPTARHTNVEHFWIAHSNSDVVKSKKAKQGQRLTQGDLESLMGKGYDPTSTSGYTFALIVDEVKPKFQPKKTK
jgi:8-oxo-dGTP pyrophosphatase MutT (NUDIX family)